MGENFLWHATWHQVEYVSCLRDIAFGPTKKDGPNVKLGTITSNQIAIGSLKYYIVIVGTLTTHSLDYP